MKPKVVAITIALCLGTCGARAVAQRPTAQLNLAVVVVNAHVDPAQPVPAVRVSLSYVDGSSRITDARDVTNPRGEAWLQVSADVAQRGDVRIEIAGASDLVIFQPADGQLQALPATVTVRLLPKGSPALLGPAQIEAMLHRSLLQVSSLQRQNVALKSELAGAQKQKQDLTAELTDWATQNGFPLGEVDQRVQRWAEDIQRRSDQATLEQKALAEVALKHYDSAAQLFGQAADADEQALNQNEEKMLADFRNQLAQLMRDKLQRANALQLNLQYHEATQVLQGACDRAVAESGRFPEDQGLWTISLDATGKVADARRIEGEVSAAADSIRLLAESVDDFRGLAGKYSQLGDRQGAAKAQLGVGSALMDEGERVTGDQSMALLNQSVQAFQGALQVYTRTGAPEDWGRTQTGLGNTLTMEADRTAGEKSAALLDQSVQHYESALEVYSKDNQPQAWAEIQADLGNTLWDEADRAPGDQAMMLFDKAVQACHKALEVYTRADQPLNWAATQTNLGNALWDQARRASGDKAMALFDQAVQAFQSALEVFTETALPQDWATTRNDLGNALDEEGKRATGEKSAVLLDQAVQAFQSAFDVYTQAALPQEWSRTQANLGNALTDEGVRASGDKAAALLDQAVRAFQKALEVRTQAAFPQGWARVQTNLGIALKNEGEQSTGEKALALFDQAAQAYRSALQVYTKADSPQEFARAQNNLGNVLEDEGEHAAGDRAIPLFDQAIQAYQSALEVRTRVNLPQDWARTQTNLGIALKDEGERETGDKAAALLERAVSTLELALEVRTRADLPHDWALTELNLGVAHAAQGNYTAAAAEYEASLEVDPDSLNTVGTASELYRDKLYRYDRALELATRMIQLDSSPEIRLDFMETNLTTAHFDVCVQQAAIVDNAEFTGTLAAIRLVRDTLTLACQWGAGNKPAALATEKALAEKATVVPASAWNFGGTIHFLATSPAFETGRASWIALFTSVQNGDAAGMTAALHQLEPQMRN